MNPCPVAPPLEGRLSPALIDGALTGREHCGGDVVVMCRLAVGARAPRPDCGISAAVAFGQKDVRGARTVSDDQCPACGD